MRLLLLAVLLVSQAGCIRLNPSLAGVGDLFTQREWEYRYEVQCHEPNATARAIAADQTDLLNRLGKDRWELVATQPQPAVSATEPSRCWIFTLKRAT